MLDSRHASEIGEFDDEEWEPRSHGFGGVTVQFHKAEPLLSGVAGGKQYGQFYPTLVIDIPLRSYAACEGANNVIVLQ